MFKFRLILLSYRDQPRNISAQGRLLLYYNMAAGTDLQRRRLMKASELLQVGQ